MKAKWLVVMVMAAGPMWAYGQTGGSANHARGTVAISPDIKGFGRDGAWRDGGWQPLRVLRGDQHSTTTSAVPVAAPELGLGFAASGLALCIGGVAVARGRRAS
jgi:hypothetical protein